MVKKRSEPSDPRCFRADEMKHGPPFRSPNPAWFIPSCKMPWNPPTHLWPLHTVQYTRIVFYCENLIKKSLSKHYNFVHLTFSSLGLMETEDDIKQLWNNKSCRCRILPNFDPDLGNTRMHFYTMIILIITLISYYHNEPWQYYRTVIKQQQWAAGQQSVNVDRYNAGRAAL